MRGRVDILMSACVGIMMSECVCWDVVCDVGIGTTTDRHDSGGRALLLHWNNLVRLNVPLGELIRLNVPLGELIRVHVPLGELIRVNVPRGTCAMRLDVVHMPLEVLRA